MVVSAEMELSMELAKRTGVVGAGFVSCPGSHGSFTAGGARLDWGKKCSQRRPRSVVTMRRVITPWEKKASNPGAGVLPSDPLPDDGAFLPIDLVDEDEIGPSKDPRRRERKRRKNKKPVGYREYVKKIRKCYKAWKKMRGTYGIQELLVKLSYGLNVDWRNSMNVKALRRQFRAWRSRGGAPSEDEYKDAVKMVTDPTITQEQIELGHRVVEALRAVKIWQRTEKIPDMETLREILIDLAQCGAYKELRQVIKEMIRQEKEVDAEMFYCLIHACVLGDHMEGAAATLKRMKSRKQIPSVHMYNYIIRAWSYSREQRYNRLVRTFEIEMKNRRIQPTIETYEVLFDGFAKSNDTVSPSKTWDTLRRRRIDPSVECYNGYMNCYANVGDDLTCRSLWTEMHQKGLEPNANTYGAMIRAFAAAGKLAESQEMEEQMREKGHRPSLRSHNAMILAHTKVGDMKTAMEIFIQMRETATTPSVETYSLLVEGFAQEGDVDRAVAVYRRMIDKGLKPDLKTYNSVCRALANAGRYEETKKLILKFRKGRRVVPDDYSLKYLMDGCANAGFLGGAKDAFHTTQMILRLRPCILTWNALLRACALCGDLDSARLYFRKLQRNKRSHANEESFNWMVVANARAKDFDGVREMLSDMKRRGLGLNLDSCKAMVLAHRDVDDLPGAEGAFREMLRQRVQPDTEVCNAMIEMYLTHEELDAALDVFVDMQQLDVPPNTHTYNTLIRVQAMRGAMVEIRTVAEEMRVRGVEPDIATYANRIAAQSTIDPNVLDAVGVFLEVEEGGRLSPDSQLYAALIDAHGEVGDLEGAEEVFRRMWTRKGIPRDGRSFTAMIDAYTACGDPAGGLRAYREMEYLNIAASAETCAAVVRACGKLGDMSKAEKIFQGFLLAGFEKTTLMMNALIAAYCDVGQVDEATKLLREIVAWRGTTPDRKPNATTYEHLLRALGKQGDIVRAEELFDEMVNTRNLKPSSDCFTALMDACARRSDVEGVRTWMKEMKQRKFRGINERAYVALIDAHRQRGELDQAAAAFEEIRSSTIPPTVLSFNALVAACCSTGDLVRAESILADMDTNLILPDETTYDLLFEAYLKAADHERIESLYQRVIADDAVSPTELVFRTVMRSRHLRRDWAGVESIFRTVRQPSLPLWNELNASYEQAGDLRKLSANYFDMCLQKIKVDPDAQSYLVWTRAHATAGDIEGCIWFLRLWAASTYPMDREALESMVRQFLDHGDKLAARLLHRECERFSMCSGNDELVARLDDVTEAELAEEDAGPRREREEARKAKAMEEALQNGGEWSPLEQPSCENSSRDA